MKTTDKSSRIRKLTLLGIGTLLALLACWYWLWQAAPIVQSATSASGETMSRPIESAGSTTQPNSDVINDPATAGPTDPETGPTNRQLAATQQMVAAHASLRIPEVADPDSVSNREILGTMVRKAFAQAAGSPDSAGGRP